MTTPSLHDIRPGRHWRQWLHITPEPDPAPKQPEIPPPEPAPGPPPPISDPPPGDVPPPPPQRG